MWYDFTWWAKEQVDFSYALLKKNILLLQHILCEYCQINLVPDGVTHTRNEGICQEYWNRKEIESHSFGRKGSTCNDNEKRGHELKRQQAGVYVRVWREERERVNDVIIL